MASTAPIRALAVLATAACLVAVSPEPATAARPIEERFAAMVNETRALAGKSAIDLTDRLSRIARRHTRRMVEANKLFHSDLHRLLGKGGGGAAENVGYADTSSRLLHLFLNSPAHADNLLGNWSRSGVGIVKARGRIWITHVFKS